MIFFELRRVLDTTVGDDGSGQALRLELYQSIERPRQFRARVFEYVGYRLRPIDPENDDEPAERCDDTLAAERSFNWLDGCWRDVFEADNVEEAVGILIQDCERACRGEFRRALPRDRPA
jgi:hypothetical protein